MSKYNNIICCIAKDETAYLKEWVEYHLNIGVQYFVIYDNNSIIPIGETLAQYIRQGVVHVIDCSIASRPQLRAYNHCLFHMCEKTQWIIYIDVDEFIILNKHNQISELLKEYDSFGGLCLNWKSYNAGGYVVKPLEPVMKAYKEYLPLSSAVNKHIKTILQPRYTLAMCNPHHALYFDGYYAVNENYLRVPSAFSDFSNEVAYINHYYTKSYEEWLHKVQKGRVDLNQKRKEHEFWNYNPNMLNLKDEIKEKYKNFTESSANLNMEGNIQTNSSKWLPLLSSIEKQKVEGYLNKIEMIISHHYAKTKTLGLFAGQSGISLYLFNYFKLTNNSIFEDLAYEILENIANKIKETSSNYSFVSGLCGIGWFIEYLAQNQFIENNTEELLSDIDDLFKNSIFNLLDFSLTNGMISYGMYFLSRITNPDNINLAQKEILVHIVNYLDCFLPEDISEANEPENLTIQQGYLAVIPFLCQTYKANINNYKVLRILEKYVKFILQSEKQQNTALRFPNQVYHGLCFLQWDCGDLAVANALLQVAKISNNKEWESKALEIALRTTSVKKIESPATSTLNGTAGITHLYNRLYQHYQLPELKEAAIYWLDKTLGILETQMNVPSENGLINGLVGTGLVLMAVISETEPTWDSALLMN